RQKTPYEISRDWSSDVCSSDLEQHGEFVINRAELIVPVKAGTIVFDDTVFLNFAPPMQLAMFETNQTNRILRAEDGTRKTVQMRSEERRVGEGGRAGWGGSSRT